METGSLAQRVTTAPPPKVALPKALIVERRDVTPDLWIIKLKPEVPFTFKPGQYCTIGREGVERAYSIVSAPHEPLLELFIELVPPPDGNLTPILWRLGVGDWVYIRPRAKGIFTLDERYPNHLLVATVTGVVPYVSILRDYLHRGAKGHRFYLLQGASYFDELTYDGELEEISRRSPDLLTYVPTVSRPNEERNRSWPGVTGRVNAIVEEHIQRFRLEQSDTLVYACGHPGMIEDVKQRLIPKGWKVKEERFWKQ